MISVVTPWRTLLSALGLIGSVKSEWVLMSMKPGATAGPAAGPLRGSSGWRSASRRFQFNADDRSVALIKMKRPPTEAAYLLLMVLVSVISQTGHSNVSSS